MDKRPISYGHSVLNSDLIIWLYRYRIHFSIYKIRFASSGSGNKVRNQLISEMIFFIFRLIRVKKKLKNSDFY